jgi:exosortase H (IPTLxxWG-CTERM-specific)
MKASPYRRKGPSSGSGPGSSVAEKSRLFNPATMFCLRFLILLLVFAGLSATPQADRLLHRPLSSLFARLAAPVLSAFGPASADENILVFKSFPASVEEACDGVLPTLIFVAAVLAFPSRPKQKVSGILLGIVVIFSINLVRLITLMLVGSYWPEVFERVHIYVWQALVIALSMGLWIFWVETYARRGTPADG